MAVLVVVVNHLELLCLFPSDRTAKLRLCSSEAHTDRSLTTSSTCCGFLAGRRKQEIDVNVLGALFSDLACTSRTNQRCGYWQQCQLIKIILSFYEEIKCNYRRQVDNLLRSLCERLSHWHDRCHYLLFFAFVH